uniref:Cytochrome c oxidase subunit 4 n=1 Tax=Ceratosolen solmsi TaxID=142686 RepID=A0A0A1CM57_9HYME|nr:mitochondrial cytochrome c oxidase subunit 4 isoform 1 [Ceratosolen solmsi]
MALRTLTLLRYWNKIQTRCNTVHAICNKIGNREILSNCTFAEPTYIDHWVFPLPTLRYKEITPNIQTLRNKEKGDWRHLSIAEKKLLYRASFRQTYAEFSAKTGEWKVILGVVLMHCTVSLWIYLYILYYINSSLPVSFKKDYLLAKYDRLDALNTYTWRNLTSNR